MSNISIDKLAEAIAEELEAYSEEVEIGMNEEIETLSKEIVNDLKNDPIIHEKTGEYKKSFRIKKVASGNGYKRNKIYNKKHQLTHLLERGHETRNKGRTKAYPHWKHAQEKADELPERMQRRLQK